MVTESIAFIIYIIPQYRLHTVTFRLVGVPQQTRPTHHLHNSFKQRKYAVFSYAKTVCHFGFCNQHHRISQLMLYRVSIAVPVIDIPLTAKAMLICCPLSVSCRFAIFFSSFAGLSAIEVAVISSPPF